MIYRLISDGEYQEAERVWADCFPGDGDSFCGYYFMYRTRPENVLAAFDGGRMVSALHMLPYPVSIGGVRKTLGFIAGVGTLPEYRKRGLASALLSEARPYLRERGCCAAVLQPFEVKFYAESGYVPMVELDWYSLVSPKCCGSRLDLPSSDAMCVAYAAFMEGRSGYMLRSADYCGLMLREYAECGGVAAALGDAYALGYPVDDRLELDEIIGKYDVGALLRVLAGQYGEVVFPQPAGAQYICGRHIEKRVFNMIDVLESEALLSGSGFDSVGAFLSSAPLAYDKY